MPSNVVLIAGDHASPALKSKIVSSFPEIRFEDLGPEPVTSGEQPSVDYPDYAESLAKRIQAGPASRGILICGSGIGMSIAANKFAGIRAAVVESVQSARLSREHNDANVLCLGARIVSEDLALEIVRTWLSTPFSEGPRHCNRIAKIESIEKR
jgi:ribose 5-phosphate isomerase B